MLWLFASRTQDLAVQPETLRPGQLTFEESMDTVLAITAPQPSSKAFLMTA